MDGLNADPSYDGQIFREVSGDTFFAEKDGLDFFATEKNDPLIINGITIRPYGDPCKKRTRDDLSSVGEQHPLSLFEDAGFSIDMKDSSEWSLSEPAPSVESSELPKHQQSQLVQPSKRFKTDSIIPGSASNQTEIESAAIARMQLDSFLCRHVRPIGRRSRLPDAKWTRKHTWTTLRHIVDTYKEKLQSQGEFEDINNVRPLVIRVIERWFAIKGLDIRELKMDCIKRDIRVALNALFVSGIFTSSRDASSSLSEERFAMHFLVRSLAATSPEDDCVSTDLIKVAFIYAKTLFHFSNQIANEKQKDEKTSIAAPLHPGRLSHLINHIITVYKVLGLVEDRVIHLKNSPGAKSKEPIESVSISSFMRNSYGYSKNKLEVPALGNGPSDISIECILRFINETGQTTVSS